ncbi:MAG: MarR family winged helix-turn-helix transcriptional regulator [Steroidobacteraceae bacterium]|nr:MarR family winged helix-turn-helix transcriptional regulator [Steroidobacteraceae bacterium]
MKRGSRRRPDGGRSPAAAAATDATTAAKARQPDLAPDLVAGYAIARLARAVARNATRRVADLLGLTLAEWRVLLVLDESSADQLDEVARRALLEPSHASVATAGLQRRRLIARSEHPGDRRRARLRRTPAGTRAVERFLAETADERRTLWSVLSDADRRTLVELLDRLVESAAALGYEDAAVRTRRRRRG